MAQQQERWRQLWMKPPLKPNGSIIQEFWVGKVIDNYKLSTPMTLRTRTNYSHEKVRTAQHWSVTSSKPAPTLIPTLWKTPSFVTSGCWVEATSEIKLGWCLQKKLNCWGEAPVGVYLPNRVFTHESWPIVCSCLTGYLTRHEHLEGCTPNVVYKEVFDRLYCVHVYVLFSVIKWLHSSHQCLSRQRTQGGYTLVICC
jgi:hypothetical protein